MIWRLKKASAFCLAKNVVDPLNYGEVSKAHQLIKL